MTSKRDAADVLREEGVDALRARVDQDIAGDKRKKMPVNGSAAHGTEVPQLERTPWWRDPQTIPRRDFLYGKHYIRKNIGASIGAGGRLKTSFGLFEALEMACGRNFTTSEDLKSGPLRVLCLNAEEDQDELDRRVAALCQYYGITQPLIEGRLFVISVRKQSQALKFATLERNGTPKLNHTALGVLRDFVKDERIDVWMLDPWVLFHSARESDNGDMGLAITQGLGGIADETNSAGEIFHHPGKARPGQDTTVEDARGASAILYAVRSARVFNFMTTEEANQLGLPAELRRRFIRIVNGKANLGPIGTAKWAKIEVENLPNGDQVACSTLWEPSNPLREISEADLERGAKVAQGGAYRADRQSPEWFGWALAKEFGIPISYGSDNNVADVKRVKAIIKKGLENKKLIKVERKNEQRKTCLYIVAGPDADLYKNPPSSRPDDDLPF